MMNIDLRYDNLLSDLISLLQQALFRYITHQQVDLLKFKNYFLTSTKSMAKLQEQFNPNRMKFTQRLDKLTSICVVNDKTNKFSLDPEISIKEKKNNHSTIKSYSHSKNNHSNTLNVIGQEQEDFVPRPKILQKQKQSRKRSGTAGIQRQIKSFTIDFQNGRPMTGERQRFHYQRYADNSFGNIRQTVMLISSQKPRKSFYDDLEKESDKPEIISQNIIKLPKKRQLSNQRKSYKINKLF